MEIFHWNEKMAGLNRQDRLKTLTAIITPEQYSQLRNIIREIEVPNGLAWWIFTADGKKYLLILDRPPLANTQQTGNDPWMGSTGLRST
jgi:hypothetical protein